MIRTEAASSTGICEPQTKQYAPHSPRDRRRGPWRIIAHLCALAVAGVFLYAAQSKIIEPRQFIIDIKNYRMVPEAYLHLVALLLP